MTNPGTRRSAEDAEIDALFVHDLRSPIAAISANFAYLRMAAGGADPSLIEAIADAEVAAQTLQHIVDNMSVLALLESGSWSTGSEDVDLSREVASCVSRLSPFSRSSEVQLRASPVGPGPVVRAPAELVRSCLDNLVHAAIRHTPRRDVVGIAARADGGWGVIEVEDGGGAIPAEIAATLFTREGQRNAKREPHARYGRGLGLLVAALAAGHAGGKVEAVARDGRNVYRACWPLSGR